MRNATTVAQLAIFEKGFAREQVQASCIALQGAKRHLTYPSGSCVADLCCSVALATIYTCILTLDVNKTSTALALCPGCNSSEASLFAPE